MLRLGLLYPIVFGSISGALFLVRKGNFARVLPNLVGDALRSGQSGP